MTMAGVTARADPAERIARIEFAGRGTARAKRSGQPDSRRSGSETITRPPLVPSRRGGLISASQPGVRALDVANPNRSRHESSREGRTTCSLQRRPGATAEERLASLGLNLPTAAGAVAAYEPWAIAGGILYTSGQLPWIDGKLRYKGKIGVERLRRRRLSRLPARRAQRHRAGEGRARHARQGRAHHPHRGRAQRRSRLHRYAGRAERRLASRQRGLRGARPPHAHDLHQPGNAARLRLPHRLLGRGLRRSLPLI